MSDIPNNPKNIVVHCKICKKEFIHDDSAAVGDGIITLQTGTYCEECLPKLFENDASEILFIIDASWGEYSKRVEYRNNKYFYAKSVVGRIINPMGVYETNEYADEITYDEALAYAQQSGRKEAVGIVKKIEAERKARGLQ